MNANSRTEIKKMLLDTGLNQKRLAAAIEIDYNSLHMAISGYRSGPRYQKILESAIAYLKSSL